MSSYIDCLAVLCEFDTSAKLAVAHLSTDVHERLREMYNVLNCTCIDCVEIEIGGESYDLWCDDEAWFKNNPIPSLYLDDDNIIFGSFIISRYVDGKMSGLLASDYNLVTQFIEESRRKLVEYIERGGLISFSTF